MKSNITIQICLSAIAFSMVLIAFEYSEKRDNDRLHEHVTFLEQQLKNKQEYIEHLGEENRELGDKYTNLLRDLLYLDLKKQKSFCEKYSKDLFFFQNEREFLQ